MLPIVLSSGCGFLSITVVADTMNWPSVAIIIPTRHRTGLTERAARSAMAQPYAGDLEVILVDDGSEDESANYLETALGSTVRLVRRPFRGVSAARNAGLADSTASFVCFLDSDDTLEPEYLNTLMTAVRETGCQGAAIGIRHHAEDGTVLLGALATQSHVLREPATAQLNLWRPLALCAGNTVYARQVLEAVGGWDELSRWGGDVFDFHARVCSRLSSLVVVAGTALNVYHHAGVRLRHSSDERPFHRYLAGCLDRLEADLEQGSDVASCYRGGSLRQALSWCWSWIGVKAYEQADVELGGRAARAWSRLASSRSIPPGAPRSLRWCMRLPTPANIRLRSTASLRRAARSLRRVRPNQEG